MAGLEHVVADGQSDAIAWARRRFGNDSMQILESERTGFAEWRNWPAPTRAHGLCTPPEGMPPVCSSKFGGKRRSSRDKRGEY